MKNNNEHAYAYVAKLVSYNKDTGVFTWLKRDGDDQVTKSFNSNFAGKECGSDNGKGYNCISVCIDGRRINIKAHRLAWFVSHGEMPKGDIDHLDGDKFNNRIGNLRDVTKEINLRNSRMSKTNTSGVSGVCRDKETGKWKVQVRANGKQHYLGLFVDIDDAERVAKNFRSANGYTDRHGQQQ